MSLKYQLLFAIVLALCIFQFVELAPENRFRRDEPQAEENPAVNILNGISEQLKDAFKEENIQKLISSASEMISGSAKAVEGQLKEWQEKIAEKKD